MKDRADLHVGEVRRRSNRLEKIDTSGAAAWAAAAGAEAAAAWAAGR